MKLVTETKFGCRSERRDDLLLRPVCFCDKILHGPFPFSSAAMCSLEVTGPSGGGSSLFELNTPRRRRQRTMPQSFYRDALNAPGRTVPQAGDSPGVSYSQPGAITFLTMEIPKTEHNPSTPTVSEGVQRRQGSMNYLPKTTCWKAITPCRGLKMPDNRRRENWDGRTLHPATGCGHSMVKFDLGRTGCCNNVRLCARTLTGTGCLLAPVRDFTFQGPFSHRRVLENAPQCHRFGKAGHCGFDP